MQTGIYYENKSPAEILVHVVHIFTHKKLVRNSVIDITIQQGNSVARDLPWTGSETNTTIFVIYILDIDSNCP